MEKPFLIEEEKKTLQMVDADKSGVFLLQDTLTLDFNIPLLSWLSFSRES